MAKSPYIKRGSIYQIGDVMNSILGTTDFNALHGGGWVLMDGQDVTGTGYHALTGQSTVPDARGLFLRGKDNARGLVPSGDLAIGTYEADTFVSHNHGGGSHNHDNGYYAFDAPSLGLNKFGNIPPAIPSLESAGSAVNRISGFTSASLQTVVAAQGGNENKPKNITVNIYVKVD